jgi:hypothetical protein
MQKEYYSYFDNVPYYLTIFYLANAFKYVLASLDDKQIIELATTIGQKAPKEFILFKWKKIDSENIVNFIKMYFGHCGYGRYDYAKDIENNNYTFSIHHDFGRKGSLFLKSFRNIIKINA